MKSAEEWVDEALVVLANVFTVDRRNTEAFIRAIQDDARIEGRADGVNGRMSMAEDGAKARAEEQQSYRENAFSNLRAAMTQMVLASGGLSDMTPCDRQHARDNATEHRRIAEAYIALAQAVNGGDKNVVRGPGGTTVIIEDGVPRIAKPNEVIKMR